jgi:MoxR-like ATPase
MFAKILSVLTSHFIYCEELARVIALAIESGKNLLLWGPAGHGKSEMIQQALLAIASEEDIYVQSFGEGMDEATIWGGLDFAALEKEKVLRYFPEQSFLAHDYAVFEELFDAPASVLLALKDTLTAKKLRKGSQAFAMRTRCVIALTNKDPSEVSQLGPAAHALIERFPLQLNVKWSSYTAADYVKLFEKVAPRISGADLNGSLPILAEMVAKAGQGGEIISPRSAVHALGVIKTSAAMRGSRVVEKRDLLDLRFIDGMEGLAATLQQEIDKAIERAAAEGKVAEAERKLAVLITEFEESKRAASPIRLLQAARRLTAFVDEASALKVTDGLTEKRKQLRETAGAKALEAQTAALAATRV